MEDPPERADATPPGVARRFAARFALLAFGLYHVPLLLNDYPSFGGGGFSEDGLAPLWGHVFTRPGLWIARSVFHFTGPMLGAAEGDNGDTCEEYCRLLAGVVIAAVGAIAWTIADRKKPRAPWVPEALRVLLRYAIAIGLASYAVAKILPQQFRPLGPLAFEARVGELTPMRLLWDLMGYSRPYALFGGLVEMAVVVLLCFRRTTALGALLCLPVMTNVALMNFCYGVPVKLFSAMTVLSAAVLVLFDAPRLVDLLWHHRAIPAAPPPPPFRSRRLNLARWLLKIVLVGGAVISSVLPMLALFAPVKPSPADGTWVVQSFVRGGQDPAPDPTRWRRIVVGRIGRRKVVLLRREDERLVQCTAELKDEAHTLALQCPSVKQNGDLTFTTEGDLLRLHGTFDGEPVEVAAKRRDEVELPLVSKRFYWADDG